MDKTMKHLLQHKFSYFRKAFQYLYDSMSDPHYREGVVIRSTGSWMTVRDLEGDITDCRIKGKFRLNDVKSTNPVAVGDRVVFHMVDEKVGVITDVLERNNYIVRKSIKLSKRLHIIAANIDQAVLIVTLARPRTSSGFIDRFLVTAEAYHIPARLVFNKVDLYHGDLLKKYEELQGAYHDIGYEVIATSATERIGLDEFSGLLKNKTSLLAGHSGVGKSALINAIEPDLNLKTGIISDAHLKGKHTTTFAEMFPLSIGGYIIDTPGIKEFGLIDFGKQEVGERFPEMLALMDNCRFKNCTHVHEPDCAVKQALSEGRIPEFRYRNYLGILNDDYWEETENYD